MPALTCPDCPFTASRSAELEKHFASQHGGDEGQDGNSLSFQLLSKRRREAPEPP